jgi:peptidyl-tRNA hydrolase
VADDPFRMFLVLRRGAIATLERAGELAGGADVRCVRTFGGDAAYADVFAAWSDRPGKVTLRARNDAQWRQVLAEPHVLAGDPDGEAVAALPPRRRSQRGPLLERLQAMSSTLVPAPARADPADMGARATYVLNPAAIMSSGKTIAQIAHAAVMAAAQPSLESWVAAGTPGRVLAPDDAGFDAAGRGQDCVARVIDAGLTEVPAGTVTVVALAPMPAGALPPELR